MRPRGATYDDPVSSATVGVGDDDFVTGEAVALDLPPASIGSRILSGFLDYLIVWVATFTLVSAGTALCFPIGRLLPVWAVIAIAVSGWLIQLAGHAVWEKKSPSFLTNLVHALVGPLFFVALLTGDYSLKPQQLAPSTSRA